ncbi:MAG: hypothetical protein ACLFMT_04360 [Halobacteriales archaeon]
MYRDRLHAGELLVERVLERGFADDVVCPETPVGFSSVGEYSTTSVRSPTRKLSRISVDVVPEHGKRRMA